MSGVDFVVGPEPVGIDGWRRYPFRPRSEAEFHAASLAVDRAVAWAQPLIRFVVRRRCVVWGLGEVYERVLIEAVTAELRTGALADYDRTRESLTCWLWRWACKSLTEHLEAALAATVSRRAMEAKEALARRRRRDLGEDLGAKPHAAGGGDFISVDLKEDGGRVGDGGAGGDHLGEGEALRAHSLAGRLAGRLSGLTDVEGLRLLWVVLGEADPVSSSEATRLSPHEAFVILTRVRDRLLGLIAREGGGFIGEGDGLER